jgi:hypothetical protein
LDENTSIDALKTIYGIVILLCDVMYVK